MSNIRQCFALYFLISTMVTKCAVDPTDDWRQIEVQAQNAVVQVWSQIAEFNWLDPFKCAEQGQSSGTGFFIDARGYILTNYHVIRGAKSIFVTVPRLGKKPLEVTVIGVCPEVDIALLKLTQESYDDVIQLCGAINSLEFGDSDDLYATEPVLALGYPLGVSSLKSTLGIIGGRDFIDGRAFMHTQTPINPGNSGGPLLHKKNGRGKVIGICTAIMKNADNYGLIVPINDVAIILENLYTTKFVRRPSPTFGSNHTTDAHARLLNNPVPGGLYVNYIQENSMEERAGLKVGDMIYEITIRKTRYEVDEFGEVMVQWRNGTKISYEELLARCAIHDPLKFVVYRNGQRLELSCKFEEPALLPVRIVYAEYEPKERDYEMIAGVVFMELKENHISLLVKHKPLLANYLRPENQTKSVLLITRILPGSVAHMSECLSQGFILHKINGKTVRTLTEFREALLLSAKTRQIAIQTKDKFATVLDLEKVLRDEPRLARDFKFPVTPTVLKLMELSGIKNIEPQTYMPYDTEFGQAAAAA